MREASVELAPIHSLLSALKSGGIPGRREATLYSRVVRWHRTTAPGIKLAGSDREY